MHDKFKDSQTGATALSTAIAFAAGLAVGLNVTSGHTAALTDLRARAVAESPVSLLPPLPREIAKAYSLGYGLTARAEGEPRECAAGRDDRCTFN